MKVANYEVVVFTAGVGDEPQTKTTLAIVGSLEIALEIADAEIAKDRGVLSVQVMNTANGKREFWFRPGR